MVTPRISLIGIHRVSPSEELIREQADILYEEHSTHALKSAREQIQSAVLVEVLVTNPDQRFRVDDFLQPDRSKPPENWQAPYAEAYLSSDGLELLSRWGPPASLPDEFRLAFFIHWWQPTTPLHSSYGPLAPVQLTAMPDRLFKLVPYEPTD